MALVAETPEKQVPEQPAEHESATTVAPGASGCALAFAGPLAEVVTAGQAVLLRPCAFFVAWSGVLTLAYTGFPDALRLLKSNINNSLQSLGKENPGSRWPKTSLGCLREGQRLTPAQLETIKNICVEESGVFQQPQSKRAQAVLVDQLEVVIYECRCLERKISKHILPLKAEVDASEPSKDEKERVQALIGEMDAQDYWYHAARDGNRETHYRGQALGVTLVHELAAFTGRPQPLAKTLISRTNTANGVPVGSGQGSTTLPTRTSDNSDARAFSYALPAAIRNFRARVDQELPGLYTWFAEDSLHITIRAIM